MVGVEVILEFCGGNPTKWGMDGSAWGLGSVDSLGQGGSIVLLDRGALNAGLAVVVGAAEFRVVGVMKSGGNFCLVKSEYGL